MTVHFYPKLLPMAKEANIVLDRPFSSSWSTGLAHGRLLIDRPLQGPSSFIFKNYSLKPKSEEMSLQSCIQHAIIRSICPVGVFLYFKKAFNQIAFRQLVNLKYSTNSIHEKPSKLKATSKFTIRVETSRPSAVRGSMRTKVPDKIDMIWWESLNSEFPKDINRRWL